MSNNCEFKTFVSIVANDIHQMLIDFSDALINQDKKHIASQLKNKAGNFISIYNSCGDYRKESVVILNKVKEFRDWIDNFATDYGINAELDVILEIASKRSGIGVM